MTKETKFWLWLFGTLTALYLLSLPFAPPAFAEASFCAKNNLPVPESAPPDEANCSYTKELECVCSVDPTRDRWNERIKAWVSDRTNHGDYCQWEYFCEPN